MPTVTVVDVDDLVFPLLERLGFNPNWVQHLDLWPREARVTVYTPNAEGKKHVDLETGDVVTETHTIELKRYEKPSLVERSSAGANR
jgi:hypothetical protein